MSNYLCDSSYLVTDFTIQYGVGSWEAFSAARGEAGARDQAFGGAQAQGAIGGAQGWDVVIVVPMLKQANSGARILSVI